MESLTSGVDWITATLPLGAVLDQEWVYTSLQCLDAVVSEGYELEYSGLNGYKGVKAGGCFVGSRDDGHMVQFSGRFAHQFFDKVYRYDAHISRLDIQTTVKYKNMPKRVAKEAYRDAIKENETIPVSRRRKIYIIVGSDGGDTCYVGSAKSDERGRIYNKEVQSEDPNYSKCWRFECTLRNDRATSAARSVANRITDREQFCSDLTAIWYEKRGVSVPWIYDETLIPLPPIKTQPSDIETKLNWLKHQVRPTIEYLTTVVDKAVILELLGLS